MVQFMDIVWMVGLAGLLGGGTCSSACRGGGSTCRQRSTGEEGYRQRQAGGGALASTATVASRHC